MSYESERQRILDEADDLDENLVNYTREELHALQTRVLALLAIAAVGSALQYYYRNLLNAINAELDTFERNYLTKIAYYFDGMWALGIASVALVAKESGVIYAPSMTLDEQAYKEYILSEAKGASDALRKQMTGALTRALLSDTSSVEDVVHLVANLLDEKKVVSSFFVRITSDIYGAFNIASEAGMQDLLDKAPQLADNVTKTWEWSHVQRAYHAAMDGKTIPLKDLFKVPGGSGVPAAEMYGPHDPNAPPGQVINCKCRLVYNVGGKRGESES